MVDLASGALRALGCVLLLQAAGIILFLAIFGDGLAVSLAPLRRAARLIGSAALVVTLAHYLLEAGRMGGDWSSILDPSLQRLVWASSTGSAFIARLAGLMLALVGLGGLRPAALLGPGLISASFALTGHTSVHSHRWLLAALLTLHVLIVVFWFGALWPLSLASLRETPAIAARVIERFSALAIWAVPLIAAAGVALAVALVPDLATFRAPYGELLLAKAAGFCLLMGAAAANRWRLGPAVAQGTLRAGQRFRRSVAAEFIVIAAIITITSVMTGFYSPE